METKQQSQEKESPLIQFFVGSYSQSISLIAFHPSSNTFETPLVIPNIVNASFLKHLPKQHLLVAVSETQDAPAVVLIDLEKTSATYGTVIQTLPTHGSDPCHICYASKHNLIIVSNYSGSTVSTYSLVDHRLTFIETLSFKEEQVAVKTARQDVSHPHSATLDETQSYVFIADLGCDVIRIYSLIDCEQQSHRIKFIRSVPVSTGTGPRHLQIVGNTVYVLGELSHEILVFQLDTAEVELKQTETIRLLEKDHELFATSTAAEIKYDAFNHTIYTSIRGVDEILSINSTRNIEKFSTQGKQPRNFNINDEFVICANQESNNIIIFSKKEGHTKVAHVESQRPTYIELIQ